MDVGLKMAPYTAKDVRPRAQSALAASPIYELRELTVEETSRGIVISGSVSSFYHKQLAQEAVREVAGTVEVVNSVQVD
jgi:osmotically-inducible protein OsmY